MKNKFCRIRIIITILVLTLICTNIGPLHVRASDTIPINVTSLATGDEAGHDCSRYLINDYNTEKHWQKCSVCGAKYGSDVAHSFVTTGTAGCNGGLGYQYKSCSCGYSSQLPKTPHTHSSGWACCNDRNMHYKSCSVCHVWSDSGVCKDASGNVLGCKTGRTGYCVYCGAYRSGQHGMMTSYSNGRTTSGTTITDSGILTCYDGCGTVFGTYSVTTYRLSDTQSKAVLNMTSYIAIPSVNIYLGNCYNIAQNGVTFQVTSKSQSGNSIYAEAIVTHNKNNLSPGTHEIHFSTNFFSNNAFVGNSTYMHMGGLFNSDWIAPSYVSANVSYANYSDGYATKAVLEAKYSEAYSDNCYVRLLDSNQSTVLSDWAAATKSGNTYTRNIDITNETNVNKTLYIQARDTAGNLSSLTPVTIQNLDSKAPTVTASGETSKDWTKYKLYTATATDNGAGNVKIAFNNNSADKYVTAEKSSNTYSQTYRFEGDLYGSTVATVYYKDKIGNETSKFVTIWNIDNTAPTITSVSQSKVVGKTTCTVNAHDENATLKAAGKTYVGSNLKYWAVTTTKTAPSTGWKDSKTFDITATGTYYFWAKDAVGNVSAYKEAYVAVNRTLNFDYAKPANASASITGNGTASKTVAYNAKIGTLPSPALKGWRFNGWSIDNSAITSETEYAYDVNKTAKAAWLANTYTVKYNGNNADSGSINDTSHVYDVAKNLPVNTFVRTGYIFNGWNTNASGTGTSYSDKQSVKNLTATHNGTVTLYAKWKPRTDIKYIVNHYTMNLDGSTYSLRDTKTYNNGTSDSYITIGNYQNSYPGFTYDGGIGVKEGSVVKPTNYQATALVARDGTLVMNLYYTRNRYTLTVEPNGGVFEGSTNNYVFELFYEESKVINSPTKEGDRFIGWVLSDLTTGSSLRSGGPIQNGGFFVFKMGHTDVTIQARWSVLPVFTDVMNSSFYEGQTVTVDMLRQLIMAQDEDKLPEDIASEDICIDSVLYRATDESTTYPDPSSWKLDTGSNKIGDVDITYSVEDVLPDISDITNPIGKTEPAILSVSGNDIDGAEVAALEETMDVESSDVDMITDEPLSIEDLSDEQIDEILCDMGIDDVEGAEIELLTDVESGVETIRVTYTKTTSIIYNDLPQMSLNPIAYISTNDSSLVDSTIVDFLKSYAFISDAQDDIDNDPWWLVEDTSKNLKESLEITGVYDISFNPAFEIENRSVVNEIKNYSTVEQIYALKTSNPSAFNAILSYRVVFDAHDQWGKYVSGKFSEEAIANGVTTSEKDMIQSENDRSMMVMCINDANYNSVFESIRDVNMKHISSVDSNSFWGDAQYGGEMLKDILSKKDNKNNQSHSTYSAQYSQPNINIVINDYSN